MGTSIDWAADAGEALRNLGFTLRNSDRPSSTEGSQLLVALRDRPTLRHFDPERLTCWVAAADRGRPIAIDRTTPAGDRSILWGHLHVIDRLGVENRFLTFGGRLRIADLEPGLRVIRHDSPGPLVRWGGHSQGLDPLAGEIGAFFGRLIVPVDYAPGGEARVAAEPAGHLYAAFLRDAEARRRTLRQRDAIDGWLGTEATRIRRAKAEWWEAAGRLLDDLDLGPEGQASERAAAGA